VSSHKVAPRETREITVVEMLKKMAMDVSVVSRMELLNLLNEKGISLLTDAMVVRINDTSVTVSDALDTKKMIEVDSVVIAEGARPNNKLKES
jgi:NADH dehydrogenase FAD-containing subunit